MVYAVCYQNPFDEVIYLTDDFKNAMAMFAIKLTESPNYYVLGQKAGLDNPIVIADSSVGILLENAHLIPKTKEQVKELNNVLKRYGVIS